MPERNLIYRPPSSDSDSDYDGFYFGDDIIKKTKTPFRWVQDDEQQLQTAAQNGELEEVKRQIALLKFNVNSPLRSGLTLLLHACYGGYLDFATYLLGELDANPNKQVDSVTPLMAVCSAKKVEPKTVEKIVLLLLKHGAVINVSDKYGATPFMHACRNGYTAVVRLLIANASFDAIDNQGCTAIFHAVENNHSEIVKILVDAGVDTGIPNLKGYTPLQVAQFHGFCDMLELLPREKVSYTVPTKFLSYSTLRDYIPRIFLRTECPEYFQEVHSVLYSLNMSKYLEFFAQERVSLLEFLVMDDARLKEIGIHYPIFRMKIMRGLLDFHLNHWTTKTITAVKKDVHEDFYEILLLTANQLQHLVIITASLRFIKMNLIKGALGGVQPSQLQAFARELRAYRTALNDVKATTKYLSTFSPPKNLLYIDYEDVVNQRKRHKLKSYFKYTTSIIVGISVFVCLKWKNIF